MASPVVTWESGSNLVADLPETFVIIFTFPTVCFSAYPKLVSTLVDGFETIKDWIIRIATPAAAVAVRHRYFYEKI